MGPEPISDEDLMAQVVHGSSKHLELLVRRYIALLIGFVRRMIVDPFQAEEIVQDVFFIVWHKRSQFQVGRPFKPWLYTIALNRCRQILRDQPPTPQSLSLLDEAAVRPGPSPSETIMADETTQLIQRSIDRLPSQQRAVVLLRLWEDLSYAQIAQTIGVTEATARSHMHHALQSLRKELDPIC